jgi:DNA-binding NarL/FixJ family response regulator
MGGRGKDLDYTGTDPRRYRPALVPPGAPNGELRVLLVDDHRLFAESLMALLSEDDRIRVVGLATDGREAVEMAIKLRPDVILMDLKMPVIDGLEATRRIRGANVPAQILLLTGTEDHIDPADAIDAGANAFLRKELSIDELRTVFFEVASLTSVLGASLR